MLGQEGDSLHFRVRSPVAGENGQLGEGRWANVFTDDAVYDLIATYRHGHMRLFKNGSPVGAPIIQRRSWAGLGSNSLGFALVLLFVPLGLLCRIGWSDATRRSRIGALAGVGVSTAMIGLLLAQAYYDTGFEIGLPAIGLIGVLGGDGLAGLLLGSGGYRQRENP